MAIWIVIGLSQMVVLAIGQMNISVGAIGGVTAMFLGWLLEGWGLPWPVAVLLGTVGFGFLLGAINGLVIVRTRINAFIVTLGSASVFTGLMYHRDQGRRLPGLPPSDFLGMGGTRCSGCRSRGWSSS